jgi:hypothetical protein
MALNLMLVLTDLMDLNSSFTMLAALDGVLKSEMKSAGKVTPALKETWQLLLLKGNLSLPLRD